MGWGEDTVEASTRRSDGRTLAGAAAGTALVLIAFTTPLATLPATAAGYMPVPPRRRGFCAR
jgi:hypothetical protein